MESRKFVADHDDMSAEIRMIETRPVVFFAKSVDRNERTHDGDEMIPRQYQKLRPGQTWSNIGGRRSWFKGKKFNPQLL